MQRWLRMKTKFNAVRLEYLQEYWKRQICAYRNELSISNDEDDKDLLQKFEQWNEPIAQLLLKLYIRQCKFKHSMLFMQFRNMICKDP